MSGARSGWWLVPLALLVTGGLALAATWLTGERIQSDLAARSRTALDDAGVPSAEVSFDGRDATVEGVARDETARALDAVRGVDGVRVAEVGASGQDPAPQPGVPDRQRLQERIDRLLDAEPITFQPETAELTPQGEATVSRVLDLVSDAPTSATFEVGGHVARVPGGDPAGARELSKARADTVAGKLVASGIADDRVRAVGYGDTRPRSATGSEDVDRRVEITVR